MRSAALLIYAIIVSALLTSMMFEYEVKLGQQRDAFASERLARIEADFQLAALQHSFDVYVQDTNMSMHEMAAMLSDARNWSSELQGMYVSLMDEYSNAEWRHSLLEEAVPFAATAENVSASHEYVANVYDCDQFSQACIDQWDAMGYRARRQLVRVDCSVFDCSSGNRHSIALVQVPVECTPSNPHIIPPSEFKAYGLIP
jgi:hypothetical protein